MIKTKQLAAMGLGFLWLLGAWQVCYAQNPVKVWVETYGRQNHDFEDEPVLDAQDWLLRIRETSDGYVGAGWTTESHSSTMGHTYTRTPSIIKLDKSGNKLWDYDFDDNLQSYGGEFKDIVVVSDGYVAVGVKAKEGTTCTGLGTYPFLVKLDFNGNVLIGPKFINRSDYRRYYSMDAIIQKDATSGHFLIAGMKTTLNTNCDPTGYPGVMIEIDENLDPVGSDYEYDADVRFRTITPTFSGSTPDGYVLAGGVGDVGAEGPANLFALKINTSYDEVWDTEIDYVDATNLWMGRNDYVLQYVTVTYPSHSRVTNEDNACTGGFSDNDFIVEALQLSSTNDQDIVFSGVFNFKEGTSKDVSNLPYDDGCLDNGEMSTAPKRWAEGDAFVIRLDKDDGSFVWINDAGHLSAIDFNVHMRKTSDDKLVICGSDAHPASTTSAPDYPDGFIAKINGSDGSTAWRKRVENTGTNFNCIYDVTLDGDNTYVLAGNNKEYYDEFLFIKLTDCQMNATFSTAGPIIVPTTLFGTGGGIVDQFIKGTVDIYSDLTLNGVIWEFADTRQRNDYNNITEETKIVIHPGATLTLTNGAILSAYQGCDDAMWDGIEVLGNSTLSQTTTNQGRVIVDGSTIQDARIGIKAIDGGIVVTEDYSGLKSVIKDCRVGIQFEPYAGPGGVDNISTINETTFDCLSPLPTTYYGGEGMETHVKLDQVRGVTFDKCLFKNTGSAGTGANGYTCGKNGTGIYANSAGFKINPVIPTGTAGACYDINWNQLTDGTQFISLDEGIEVINPLSNAYEVTINLSQFHNVKQGISLTNVDGADLILNYFYYSNTLPEGLSTQDCPVPSYLSMYLEDCHDFLIQNNKVTTASSGVTKHYDLKAIWLKNSGVATSRIFWNQVLNRYPTLPCTTPPCALPTGFDITGLYVEGSGDVTKDIRVHDNYFLDNNYALDLYDLGFARPAPTGLGVDNDFIYSAPLASTHRAYSANLFTYEYFNPLRKIPQGIWGGSFTQPIPAASFQLSTAGYTKYCMDDVPSDFPTAPQFITQEEENILPSTEFQLSVYPNPSSGNVVISYLLPEHISSVIFSLTDALGREIRTVTLENGSEQQELNLSDFNQGIYFYTVTDGQSLFKQGNLLIISR